MMFTKNISQSYWLIMLKLVTFMAIMHQLALKHEHHDYKDVAIGRGSTH